MRRSRYMLSAIGLVALLLSGCVNLNAQSKAAATHTPTPLPTSTPTYAPTDTPTKAPVAGPISFHDSLASNTNNWQNDGQTCVFKSDGYHVSNAALCTSPIDSFGDGTISVQARQVSGDITQGYSIVFRLDMTNIGFYLFLVDSNGKWRAGKVANGQATYFVNWTANSAIHQGLNQTNTLKVSAYGSHFVYYVNNVRVGQADDAELASGSIALYGNQNIDVVFTNFSVTP